MQKGEGGGIATKADRKIFRLTHICVLYHSGPDAGHVAQNPRCSHFLAEKSITLAGFFL